MVFKGKTFRLTVPAPANVIFRPHPLARIGARRPSPLQYPPAPKQQQQQQRPTRTQKQVVESQQDQKALLAAQVKELQDRVDVLNKKNDILEKQRHGMLDVYRDLNKTIHQQRQEIESLRYLQAVRASSTGEATSVGLSPMVLGGEAIGRPRTAMRPIGTEEQT